MTNIIRSMTDRIFFNLKANIIHQKQIFANLHRISYFVLRIQAIKKRNCKNLDLNETWSIKFSLNQTKNQISNRTLYFKLTPRESISKLNERMKFSKKITKIWVTSQKTLLKKNSVRSRKMRRGY
jgi:hypothetical protein